MKAFSNGSMSVASASRRTLPIFTRRALAAAAMTFPFFAHAEEIAAPVTLPTVIIQSTPLAHSQDELVHPVDVLHDDELQRNQRGTLGDVLGDRPGVSNSSFGAGVGRPIIRGQGGPRVMVLDNGISTMDASTISADHAVGIDTLNADQIEIIKGPATLIYGGAASAGIVNVIDSRLPEVLTPGLLVNSDASYGSNADEKKAALKVQYGAGETQFSANYSLRKAGDFSVPGYAEREHADEHEDHEGEEEPVLGLIENSGLRTESYGVSGAWINSRGMFGVAVSRLESYYGIPGHEEHEEEAPSEEEGGVHIDLKQTRVDLRGILNNPLPDFERLETRIAVNNYRHQEIEGSGEVGTTFDVREVDGRIQLKHKPQSGWTGLIGVHGGNRDFTALGDEAAFAPPVMTQSTGLFSVEAKDFGKTHVELGARVDHIRHNPDEGSTPKSRFTPYTFSAGVNFSLTEHMHLRMDVQRAQRAPASEELYANGAHLATTSFEHGNHELKAETANNFDISLGHDIGRFNWELSGFYNRINDYVYQQEVDADADGIADRVDESGVPSADGELLLLDYAQKNATLYGGEFSAKYKLIRRGPWQLDLRAQADTVRARLNDGGNLPRITPTRFGGGIDARYAGLSAGLSYLRSQQQNRVASLETTTPGYDLLSSNLAYEHLTDTTKTTIYLQGRNLLNEKIRLSTSFLKDVAPQPGRSIFIGVRFEVQPKDQ